MNLLFFSKFATPFFSKATPLFLFFLTTERLHPNRNRNQQQQPYFCIFSLSRSPTDVARTNQVDREN
ncbi:hypothetical protein CKAN_02295700 [Cinnamomum micranthum f. kanehirae]|uniref:Uncharacterized protein n=1 Tax=Cinnamomum micranthum f. kanehirae TaxID=337451 RepID=A0A3S3NEW9_9MAGN|nr:hypothetical protein CKAN_02295700 [Cinnamomum micranthum f. kanehirae]